MLYEYKWRDRYSIKPSEIYDENGTVVGIILRTYSNAPARWLHIFLDIIFNGLFFFTDYQITDAEGRLKLKAHQLRTYFKRRQYLIDYYDSDQKYVIHLVDQKVFDLGEKTTFEFKGNKYVLQKSLFHWAQILLNGEVIAEWKEISIIPFKVQFRLLDKSHEDRVLLLIGIFHTYLHVSR